MSSGDAEMSALVVALDGDAEFEIALGEMVGRFRRRRDMEIQSREAARLLPLGADVVAMRQGCHRATVYRRAHRANVVAPILPSATNY